VVIKEPSDATETGNEAVLDTSASIDWSQIISMFLGCTCDSHSRLP
jgi:hypothetical protein